MTLIRQAVAGLLLASSAVGLAQESMEPPGYGVFCKVKDKWQKLDYVSPLNASAGAFSGVTLSFNGAGAALQLADHRPVFYVDGVPSARNMVIVVLDRKKDHRDLKVIRSGVFAAKGGPDKKHLLDVVAQSVNDHTVSVSPSQDLGPGEYILTDSGGYGGYDFGISEAGGPEVPPAIEPPKPSGLAARDFLLKTINASFTKEGVAGYTEIAGDKLIIHSERASAVRFHMIVANEKLISVMREAGIATCQYTNDAEQNFAYDVKAGRVTVPAAPQANESK
jgi:hypothetical protein